MNITPINYSLNTNSRQSFRGTLDKSVTAYTDVVQKNLVEWMGKSAYEHSGKIVELKGLTQSLKNFAESLNPNAILKLRVKTTSPHYQPLTVMTLFAEDKNTQKAVDITSEIIYEDEPVFNFFKAGVNNLLKHNTPELVNKCLYEKGARVLPKAQSLEKMLIKALKEEQTYLNVWEIFDDCCKKMNIEHPNDYTSVLNKAIDSVRTERLKAKGFIA